MDALSASLPALHLRAAAGQHQLQPSRQSFTPQADRDPPLGFWSG